MRMYDKTVISSEYILYFINLYGELRRSACRHAFDM